MSYEDERAEFIRALRDAHIDLSSSESDSENDEGPAEEREWCGHKSTVVDGLDRLKQEEKICDFIIVIQGEEFPVHRSILAAVSKYFEAMLTHETAEKRNGRVEIQGITLKAGKQCIEFMYTGKAAFDLKNPAQLIHASELLALHPLTDLYFSFLKEKLGVENCLKYLHLAEKFNIRTFAEFFKQFSVKNFEDTVRCEDFKNMSLEILEQFIQAVPAISRESEAAKWTAIATWVNCDCEKRDKSFIDLFKRLQLKYLPEGFLRDVVLGSSLVKSCAEAKEMVLNAVLDPAKPKPGKTGLAKRLMHIVCCSSESRMLHTYDVKSGTMSRFGRIPSDVFEKHIDIASVSGEVYLTSVDAVSKFRDGKLVKLINTGYKSEYHQCIARGSVIYVISSERTYKYYTQSNQWSELHAKVQLGKGFFTTSSSSFIYALGGSGSSRMAKEFNFSEETWEPIASMCDARIFGAAAWHSRKVYAFGGQPTDFSYNRMEFYCPNSDVWSYLPTNVKCSQYNCKAFSVGSTVLIVGGRKGAESSRTRRYPDRCEFCQLQPAGAPFPCLVLVDVGNLEVHKRVEFQTNCGLACAVYFG